MFFKNKLNKEIHSNREYELFTHTQPRSPITEAYRTLRTNLGFSGMDRDCRSILISSTNPMDGKSTVVANLGVVLAQNGKKTIIVDCDLRKPVQHKIFKTENNHGVTNCLLNTMTVEEAACPTPVDHLTILPSGPIPPNPAEVLSSHRTQELFDQLKTDYDYVLIDAPPVLAVSDATILSTQLDGVILVVRQGVTRNNLIRDAKEQFTKASARMLGVVINYVKIDRFGYQYYYYYSDERA